MSTVTAHANVTLGEGTFGLECRPAYRRIGRADVTVRALFLAFALIFSANTAFAQAHLYGDRNLGQRAPDLHIDEWINGEPVSLDQLKGKVVIIDFFQLWCPGCNAFSIPLLKHWEEEFAKDIKTGALVVLSVHTVFEGHDYQSPERLKEFIKRKKIRHLVGIDRHQPGHRVPETMRRFGTRGTPEMAFIDKSGLIRFQRFGSFQVEPAQDLLRRLLAEPPPS